jgi:uncharacterized protein (TIGR03067 family)
MIHVGLLLRTLTLVLTAYLTLTDALTGASPSEEHRTGRIDTATRSYLWFTLKSGPAAATCNKSESPQQDLDLLQGEWQLELGVRDGKEMPAETRKAFRCVIRGHTFTITRNGTPVEAGSLQLDPTKKPKAVDFALAEDKQALGIYELGGDTYKQCYARPGKVRPQDFTAKEGTGDTLSVWRRIKK